jgi:hypothetical protein
MSLCRQCLLGFMTFLIFLMWALSCVGAAGTSHVTHNIKAAAWTLEYQTGSLYVAPTAAPTAAATAAPSVFAQVARRLADTVSSKPNGDPVAYFGLEVAYFPGMGLNSTRANGGHTVNYGSCGNNDDYYALSNSACSDCEYAGKHVGAACGFAIFFAMIIFVLNFIRMFHWLDRVIYKVTVLVFCFMNFITLAAALGIWNDQCVHKLNAINTVGGNYEFYPGNGMGSIAAAFFFNLVIFFVSLCTPTQDTSPIQSSVPPPQPSGNYNRGGNDNEI